MPPTLDWVFLHKVTIKTTPTDLIQIIPPQEPFPSNLYMALMPALRWQRQAGLCEFVASLVHTVNSSIDRVTQKTVLTKQN